MDWIIGSRIIIHLSTTLMNSQPLYRHKHGRSPLIILSLYEHGRPIRAYSNFQVSPGAWRAEPRRWGLEMAPRRAERCTVRLKGSAERLHWHKAPQSRRKVLKYWSLKKIIYRATWQVLLSTGTLILFWKSFKLLLPSNFTFLWAIKSSS